MRPCKKNLHQKHGYGGEYCSDHGVREALGSYTWGIPGEPYRLETRVRVYVLMHRLEMGQRRAPGKTPQRRGVRLTVRALPGSACGRELYRGPPKPGRRADGTEAQEPPGKSRAAIWWF